MDKGVVYVVQVKFKSKVMNYLKESAKDIGDLDLIICDAASEHRSKYLRNLLGKIGTTMRVIEEGNPWKNKAKLGR